MWLTLYFVLDALEEGVKALERGYYLVFHHLWKKKKVNPRKDQEIRDEKCPKDQHRRKKIKVCFHYKWLLHNFLNIILTVFLIYKPKVYASTANRWITPDIRKSSWRISSREEFKCVINNYERNISWGVILVHTCVIVLSTVHNRYKLHLVEKEKKEIDESLIERMDGALWDLCWPRKNTKRS
jgi:hypothetical protein